MRTINKLTSKQRAELRSEAHSLKPVQHIGKDGISEAVLRSIAEAFNTRELVKIKVLDGAPASPREMALEVASLMDDVEIIQVIGGVVVLYRPRQAAER